MFVFFFQFQFPFGGGRGREEASSLPRAEEPHQPQGKVLNSRHRWRPPVPFRPRKRRQTCRRRTKQTVTQDKVWGTRVVVAPGPATNRISPVACLYLSFCNPFFAIISSRKSKFISHSEISAPAPPPSPRGVCHTSLANCTFSARFFFQSPPAGEVVKKISYVSFSEKKEDCSVKGWKGKSTCGMSDRKKKHKWEKYASFTKHSMTSHDNDIPVLIFSWLDCKEWVSLALRDPFMAFPPRNGQSFNHLPRPFYFTLLYTVETNSRIYYMVFVPFRSMKRSEFMGTGGVGSGWAGFGLGLCFDVGLEALA